MENNDLHIGTFENWGQQYPLAISANDRRRHLYVVGQTGTGKSTLLRNFLSQDIANGAGCALIEPHGDLADEILHYIPKSRVDDVVILDPCDLDRPVSFNPFYRVAPDERALMAGNITATFKHIWRDSWGPRLEYILYNTTAALLEAPDRLRPTFLSIPRMFVDDDYRDEVVRAISDPGPRRFFIDEYGRWPERQRAEALSSVQNKIGQLVASPNVRNIIGQWRPTVVLSDIMAQQKILIVRVPKGLLGEEAANLMGSLLVSGIQQASMARTALPEAQRPEFHLYLDEVQNFSTNSFVSILSEARKMGLSLICANQYLDQLSPEICSALFGNVGSLVSFRVSARDAEVLAAEVADYQSAVFRDLARGEVCVRLSLDGSVNITKLGRTHIEGAIRHSNEQNIRQQARSRYGRHRRVVEDRIARWLN